MVCHFVLNEKLLDRLSSEVVTGSFHPSPLSLCVLKLDYVETIFPFLV